MPSAPLLSSPSDQAISQGTDATLTYTLTGTANGQDGYTVNTNVNPSNMSAVTATYPGGTTFTLGGTTLALPATAGETSITVPYDNNADNDANQVNGIAAGETIVIGGNTYVVASITEDAVSNTSIIGLSTAIAGATVPAATIVGEQTTFTVTIPSGTVTTGGSGTQTGSTTVTSTTDPGETTTQGTPTVVTVNRPTLTVTKFVSVDAGATFVASANAAPGTSLIYKIVVSNTGATAASSATITDVVPAYLTYDSGSGKFATDAATSYDAATPLTEGSGGYAYTLGTRTVSHDAGTIAGGSTFVLFFRATID